MPEFECTECGRVNDMPCNFCPECGKKAADIFPKIVTYKGRKYALIPESKEPIKAEIKEKPKEPEEEKEMKEGDEDG